MEGTLSSLAWGIGDDMFVEKVLYRTWVTAMGGRDTGVRSSDGVLDLKLTTPRELGGAGGGTNPQQLFAAGYAACFLEAMKFVASRDGTALSLGTAVEVSVGMGPIPSGFGMEVELRISLPGLARAEADSLVEKAHTVCSYSNAHARQHPPSPRARLSPPTVHCRGVTTIHCARHRPRVPLESEF
jgi:Ohr subfamily peroxiredoxin